MQKAVLCMKMLLLRYSAAVICAVFILTGAVSGEDVKKAVGETVSFRPAKLDPPVTSITWKQKTSDATVKAIEWDFEDGVAIPNPRFKDITTLDEKTGEITITNLRIEYSGVYTIDINSKEQGQQFSLEVMERVPKPKITIEKSGDPDVVYLRCAYSGTIIWKNSAGETLEGTKNHMPGEFITVKNTRNPENLYTCTLKNAVSEETSDPVYERELFMTAPVPKPEIKIEKIERNPNAVYLKCEYSETIIWKKSAGETLKGSSQSPKGEVLTVLKTGNPDVFYTCTLKNGVSEETSDRVYERDLFEDSAPWWIVFIVLFILILLLAAPLVLYKVCNPFHEYVSKNYREHSCIGGILKFLDGKKAPPVNVEGNVDVNAEKAPLKSSSVPESNESGHYEDPNKVPLNSSSVPESNESSRYEDPNKEPPKADGDGGDEEARL